MLVELRSLLLVAIAARVVLSQEECITPNRKQGTCISYYDCPSMINFFGDRLLSREEREFLRLSECTGATSGRHPFMCCPDKIRATSAPTQPTATTPKPEQPLATSSKPDQPTTASPSADQPTTTHPAPVISTMETSTLSISRAVHQVSSRLLPDPRKNECGISIGMRILGGENADIDEYPWLALLEYENFRFERKFSCGGSLINERYVLTAAHCLVGEVEKKEGKLVGVRLGEYDTTTDIDCIDLDGEKICADAPLNVGVEEKIPHKDYNLKTLHNDIALLRLNQTVHFTEYIKPICLPLPDFRSSVADDVNFVTGFGRTLQGRRSAIKQKLCMKVFDQERCKEKFAAKTEITPKQLCVGGEYAKDACGGDSGGPLMKLQKPDSRSSTVWNIEGVVSFGHKCGMEGWPGVYTRVLAYMDWIQDNMRE